RRVAALERAVRDALEALVISSCEHASEEVEQRWRTVPGGEDLVAKALDRPGGGQIAQQIREELTEWQREISEMTKAGGATKRSVARSVTFDHDVVALVLIIDLLGYEHSGRGDNDQAGTSSGPSPQRLLKGLFGAPSLRSIGGAARDNLRRRIVGLIDGEKVPFDAALASAGIPPEGSAVQLYQATHNLEIARLRLSGTLRTRTCTSVLTAAAGTRRVWTVRMATTPPGPGVGSPNTRTNRHIPRAGRGAVIPCRFPNTPTMLLPRSPAPTESPGTRSSRPVVDATSKRVQHMQRVRPRRVGRPSLSGALVNMRAPRTWRSRTSRHGPPVTTIRTAWRDGSAV